MNRNQLIAAIEGIGGVVERMDGDVYVSVELLPLLELLENEGLDYEEVEAILSDYSDEDDDLE